ncbi:MAG: lycopene cyclase [Naasia sp.]|jgi:lycopene cyclase domain-containing protein|uniref:lycopene cyclase domain-containing protein n=1 Tax=Naasia sp. TaxID=2546198 RepID=UPI002621945D|nr:lycopene cyclase domain-containing protein [Naasia sp.]MCU1570321.1 lycopene cyclase [Naasia sp.]
MTYWALNALFLVPPVAIAVAAAIVARRRSGRARRVLLAAAALTLAAVLLLTAVFDNVIIGLGIVAYDPAALSGPTIGIAPVEDFAYAVAVAIGLPSLWVLIGGAREPR